MNHSVFLAILLFRWRRMRGKFLRVIPPPSCDTLHNLAFFFLRHTSTPHLTPLRMTATDDLPPPTPAVPAAPTIEPSEAEIDYEGLGENVPLHINMVAGSLAGITEHAVMFPVDVVRTRMQVLSTVPDANYASMTNAISRILTVEGFRALWRGIASVILGAGPAHALYFGTYELVKESTGGNREGHQFTSTAFAGAAATIASDAFMNPFDGTWRLSLTSDQTTHAALWLRILVSFAVCACIVPR